MHQIGLKIWSTNTAYIPDIIKYYEAKVFNYIELYTVPATFSEYSGIWKNLNIPFIIHAPHSMGGLNPAKKEHRKKNIILFQESKKFADKLDSQIIICHPGIEGDISETVIQFLAFNDKRIIVENKPFIGIDRISKCNGSIPEEIKFIMKEAGVGFCLDFGHAICAANSLQIEPKIFISDFLHLTPTMFHLSDGEKSGVFDLHLHFGQGDFNLRQLVNNIPVKSKVSIETKKDSKSELKDFVSDVNYLNNLITVNSL